MPPGSTTSAVGSLVKLGVSAAPGVQARPTSTGTVGQTLVTPGGAGATSVGKPERTTVAGPTGSGCSTTSRLPLMGSTGTESGRIATQQRSSEDSKTMRTIVTDGGSVVPKPPSRFGVDDGVRAGGDVGATGVAVRGVVDAVVTTVGEEVPAGVVGRLDGVAVPPPEAEPPLPQPIPAAT